MDDIRTILKDFTENLIHLTADRRDGDVLIPGCHLAVDRTLYSHHGIYAGYGRVISHIRDQGIIEYSMEKFAEGGEVYVIEHGRDQIYSYPQALQRARSKIGSGGYLLLSHNCEHFATWCLTGKERSSQVEKLAAAGFTLTAVAAILRARSGKSPLPIAVAGIAAAILLSNDKAQDLLGEAGQKAIDLFNEAADGMKSSLQTAADNVRNGWDSLTSSLSDLTDNIPSPADAASWLAESLGSLISSADDAAADSGSSSSSSYDSDTLSDVDLEEITQSACAGVEEACSQIKSFLQNLNFK